MAARASVGAVTGGVRKGMGVGRRVSSSRGSREGGDVLPERRRSTATQYVH